MITKDLKKKKITVAGLGKSGISALTLLSEMGIMPKGCDNDENIKNKAEVAALIKKGIQIAAGKDCEKIISESDIIILSPGIDQRKSIYTDAAEKGAIVTGELEFAWSFTKKPVVAITGTNGKSTVTELISDILELSGKRVFRGGNLGTPLSGAILNQDEFDVMVLEISSFQIDTIIDFRPDVALLLNVTQDHLDRYKNFQAYTISKTNIFKNQTENEVCILNAEDLKPVKGNPRQSFFNRNTEKGNNAFVENGFLYISFNKEKFKIDIKEFGLNGRHNLENLSASAITALEAGASIEGLKKAIRTFKGLPHRMEYCGTIENIRFINDSKATNPDSVYKALENLEGRVSLIMGGKDKGYDYTSLSQIINAKVENLVLIGETREKIKKEVDFKKNTLFAETMDEAVETAYKKLDSEKGCVILSPACSSFDMFQSYSHRGKEFVKAFQKLKTEYGTGTDE